MSMSSYLYIFVLLTSFSSFSFAQQQTITYNASPNGKYNSIRTNEFVLSSTSIRTGMDCTGITTPSDGSRRLLIDGTTGRAYVCGGALDDLSWIAERDTMYLSNLDDGKFGYLFPIPDPTSFAGIKFNDPNLSFFNGPMGNVTDDANALLSLSTTGITMRAPSTSSSPINTNTYRPAIVLSNSPAGTTPTSNLGSAVGNHGAKRLALAEASAGGVNRFYGLGAAANTLEFHVASATNGNASNPQMVLNNNGNLGLGINAPTSKLHVLGAILATTNITAGGNVIVAGNVGIGAVPNPPTEKLMVGGNVTVLNGDLLVTNASVNPAPTGAGHAANFSTISFSQNNGELIVPVYTGTNRPPCAQPGQLRPGCTWVQGN